MDIERKKELLLLVDSIAKDMRNDNCGNYTPKILNAIKIAEKYDDINKFQVALERLKSSTFGGDSEKKGYANFVNNIIKKKEYRINDLSFEELEFVFSWVGRVIKTKNSNDNNNRKFAQSNTNNYSKNKVKPNSSTKRDNHEGLNIMAEQLIKWKNQ